MVERNPSIHARPDVLPKLRVVGSSPIARFVQEDLVEPFWLNDATFRLSVASDGVPSVGVRSGGGKRAR